MTSKGYQERAVRLEGEAGDESVAAVADADDAVLRLLLGSF